MFEVKEVSPTKQKNAFWSKDIKEARKLNKEKKPSGINISVLRRGLKAALRKKTKEPVKTVKIRPAPKRDPSEIGSLGDAFAFAPPPPSDAVWKSVRTLINESQDQDEQVEDAKYVGLKDMAFLLGLDSEEEEDEVDEDPIERVLSRRPLGKSISARQLGQTGRSTRNVFGQEVSDIDRAFSTRQFGRGTYM